MEGTVLSISSRRVVQALRHIQQTLRAGHPVSERPLLRPHLPACLFHGSKEFRRGCGEVGRLDLGAVSLRDLLFGRVDMGELPHHSRIKPAFPDRTAPRAYDLPCGLGGLWRALGPGRVDQPRGPLRAPFPGWMGLLPFASTGEALGVARSNDGAGDGRHSYAVVHAKPTNLPSVYSFPRQLRIRTARWE